VLTFPSRAAPPGPGRRLARRLTRIVVETVLSFYAARAAQEGRLGGRRRGHRGAEDVSDLRLKPHLPSSSWTGRYEDGAGSLEGSAPGTSEGGQVARRLSAIEKHFAVRGCSGPLRMMPSRTGGRPEGNLALSAVSGQTPPRAAVGECLRPSKSTARLRQAAVRVA